MKNKLADYSTSIYLVAIVLLVGFVGYGIYAYYSLHATLQETAEQLSVTRLELASTTASLLERSKTLSEAQNANTDLQTKLIGEAAQNDFFGQQIQSISSTVGILDKLSKTDKELLQKFMT